MTSPFDPLSFRCGLRAKNRLALAPLTNQQSHDDGTLGYDEFAFLERRARGGFGMIETCAAQVHAEGRTFEGQLGIDSDDQLPGLTRLAGALSAQGALGVVQLQHGGARALPHLTGTTPVAPSAVARDGAGAPRALETAEVEALEEAFVRAAVRAHRAGFEGVELHAAHGYLLSQFLSRTQNVRDDAFGGSLENRARLLRGIARRIRQALPAAFFLGVRISPEDVGAARGLDLDDSLQVARWLADDGVDALHLSLWDFRRNTAKRPTEHPVPLFRKALSSEVRIIAAGSVWTRAEVESLLSLGADAVAVGKAAILDPDWARRIEDPAFVPERGPLSRAALSAAAVGPAFQDYLAARFEGMVQGGR